MTEEKSCWICRRTKAELLKEAEKDGALGEYVDESTLLWEVPLWDGRFVRRICCFCEFTLERLIERQVEALVSDDRLRLIMGTDKGNEVTLCKTPLH